MNKPQQAMATNKNRKEVKIRFVLAIVFTLTIIMSNFATAWAAVSASDAVVGFGYSPQ